MRKHLSGFTLVELSIVLVILGLLVGGVLAGQSLIRAAELRSVTTQYNGYIAAVNSFRDKYFALPGDMANATAFWGKDNTNCSSDSGTAATNGTCNGNADGTISVASAGANSRSEIYAAWKHLALAGLIEGNYTGLSGTGGAYESNIGSNVPRAKLNNAGWTIYNLGDATVTSTNMFEGTYGNVLMFGTYAAGSQTWGYALKPEEAWNLDTKMDDGRPGLGAVRVREDLTGCHTAGTSNSVALAATANYALTTTSLQCGFLLKI